MYIQSQLRRLFNTAFSPRYLLTTNTIVGTVALIGADTIQQLASHYVYQKPVNPNIKQLDSQVYVHDFKRSIGMASGGLFFSIAGHYWYHLLDTKFPGKSMISVSKKLLCEAALGPPILITFYYLVARVEGKTTQEWYKSLKETIVDIILVEWGCFLPAQALNFYLLPPRFRYLYVAIITFFYDNFLSFIFHK